MEVLKKIFELYNEINMLYIELYKLELSGNRNSNKFRDLVDLLKSKLKDEKKIYEKLFLEYEEDYEELYKIVDEYSDRPFGIRMRDYINLYDSNKVDVYENEEKEEVIAEILANIKYSKLYSACSRNMFLVYLSFLQEYADSDLFSYLREKILGFKYYNAFINHDVENILVDLSFNIDRDNYVNLYFIADSLKLKESNEIILDCFVDTIKTTIEQLLSINDVDYSDDDKKAIAINNQSMLRAGLVMIGERDYSLIKNNLNDEIEKLSTDYNKISVDIVKLLIDGRKKDRSRVKKISMRPLND